MIIHLSSTWLRSLCHNEPCYTNQELHNLQKQQLATAGVTSALSATVSETPRGLCKTTHEGLWNELDSPPHIHADIMVDKHYCN